MILINEKEVTIAKSFLEEVKEFTGDARYLQPLKEHITQLQTNKEGLTRQVEPAGLVVQLVDQVYGVPKYNEDKELVGFDFNPKAPGATWYKIHYCETLERSDTGKLRKVEPAFIKGRKVLTPEDAELTLFLAWFSRRVKGSKNSDQNKTKEFLMEIADPEGDAAKINKFNKLKNKAEYLVNWDEDEGGLSDERCQQIARHLYIDPSRFKTSELLRNEILRTITKDQQEKKLSGDPAVFGYDYLIQLSKKKGPDYEIRSVVADALAEGIIELDRNRGKFVLKSNGESVAVICDCDSMLPGKENKLVSALKLDPDMVERIKGALGKKAPKPQKVVKEPVVETPKKTEPEVENEDEEAEVPVAPTKPAAKKKPMVKKE